MVCLIPQSVIHKTFGTGKCMNKLKYFWVRRDSKSCLQEKQFKHQYKQFFTGITVERKSLLLKKLF